MNTEAIRLAIREATSSGGGNVVIPPGIWLTGAIRLDDNINLHLSKGATLRFSQDPRDYLPVVFSRHEDIECYKHSSFIYAREDSNIAITGAGTLEGQGKPWWDWKTSKRDVEALLNTMASNDVPVEERVFDGTDGRALRPAFFQPMRCRNVLVEGVTFTYGAFWTITPTYCENVIVRNVHIVTEGPYGHTPNGDGVNPSSSRNVLIENCEFDTGDDCVAIKAGRDRDGLRVNIPSENIVVRNCRGLSGHGGIVIGSETSGGVRNVYATNCTFRGTDRIVRLKTARGRGGVLENFWFSQLAGDEIAREAIRLNMLYTGDRLPAQPVTEATPTIRNIHFEDIICSSGRSYGIELLGLPERPIQNITFANMTIATARGVNLADVHGILLSNVSILSPERPLVRILDGEQVVLHALGSSAGGKPVAVVEGEHSSGITITTDQLDTTGLFLRGPGGTSQAVTVQKRRAESTARPWSQRIADSFLILHPGAVTYDSLNPDQKWNYEQGLMLVALYAQWKHTGLRKYLDFIRDNIAQYVDERGAIRTYKRTDYNLDNIGPGRALLAIYRTTGEAKYRAAADTLWRQLQEQPRTNEGGFWHKKIYPYQMWLDGLFMAQPFAAWYASLFDSPSTFDDIANQFVWVARHTYNTSTGLFYHGWDESRAQRWADPETGRSPNFWGRAMGWYAMGLVDVLDYLPKNYPRRTELITILQRLAKGIVRYQDPASGLWFQVLDQAGSAGNYREASASAMFAYSLAKGVNQGYLDAGYRAHAQLAFRGIVDSLVTVDQAGLVTLHRTCRGAGLGGDPYRDGSYEYYIGEPTRTNDKKGYGPFLLAAIELERATEGANVGDRATPRDTR